MLPEKSEARQVFILRKTVEVDAAHRLPSHPGKCANLHGHRWKFIVEIVAERLNEQGMVLDFGVIKETLGALDHKCINEISPFDSTDPTAERLAIWACMEIAGHLSEDQDANVSVTVEETPGSSVTYCL